MKAFIYFSVSSKHEKALNEIFHIPEMEGDGLLWTCAYTRAVTVARVKRQPAIQPYFQSMGQEECPCLNIFGNILRMKIEKKITVKQSN